MLKLTVVSGKLLDINTLLLVVEFSAWGLIFRPDYENCFYNFCTHLIKPNKVNLTKKKCVKIRLLERKLENFTDFAKILIKQH